MLRQNMKLGQMVVGPVSTNCYFVENSETKELILVDPGDNPLQIQKRIEEMGCKPVAILLTHGHFDHILAVPKLQELYPELLVYVSAAEKDLMEDPKGNCSWMIGESVSVKANRFAKDKEEFTLAGIKITVITTPGHTKGGCCYYLKEEQVLFSGDTLFEGSIGRTDLPTGSFTVLKESLNKLFALLPDDTDVFPGHGESTTIGYEKKYNPYA